MQKSKVQVKSQKSGWAVISLGGSIIVPDDIDISFLKKFKDLLSFYAQKRFAIICGGGNTNRKYNSAARILGKPSHADLDWLGIRSLQLNAELVRVMFGKKVYKEVVNNPQELRRIPRQQIIIGSAYAPGRSSDYDSILWAKRLGVGRVLNLSNIDRVYTADPKRSKKARPIADMTWSDYLKIIGTKWSPRLSTPFDPVAAQLARRWKISVYILNGNKLANVKKVIDEKSAFIGTILHP